MLKAQEIHLNSNYQNCIVVIAKSVNENLLQKKLAEILIEIQKSEFNENKLLKINSI